jgi:hypothetical protein
MHRDHRLPAERAGHPIESEADQEKRSESRTIPRSGRPANSGGNVSSATPMRTSRVSLQMCSRMSLDRAVTESGLMEGRCCEGWAASSRRHRWESTTLDGTGYGPAGAGSRAKRPAAPRVAAGAAVAGRLGLRRPEMKNTMAIIMAGSLRFLADSMVSWAHEARVSRAESAARTLRRRATGLGQRREIDEEVVDIRRFPQGFAGLRRYLRSPPSSSLPRLQPSWTGRSRSSQCQ